MRINIRRSENAAKGLGSAARLQVSLLGEGDHAAQAKPDGGAQVDRDTADEIGADVIDVARRVFEQKIDPLWLVRGARGRGRTVAFDDGRRRGRRWRFARGWRRRGRCSGAAVGALTALAFGMPTAADTPGAVGAIAGIPAFDDGRAAFDASDEFHDRPVRRALSDLRVTRSSMSG